MFRLVTWLIRRRRGSSPAASRASDSAGQLVTVRLPDGRVMQGQRMVGSLRDARGEHATLVLMSPPDAPPRRRRRWYSWIPRWLRWSAAIVIIALVFRRAVAWALLAALSAALHLIGADIRLPHVSFGWPWSSSTTSTVQVGPLVLDKIEGVDKPALGTTTFSFLFTHTVSKSLGILPCWYSATFSAVAKASATVDLNPGPSWWNASTGHYVLRVLSKPTAAAPGEVAVSMALPLPQLPQTVHDVSIDNTLSQPVSSDHSWTYPGLACGVLIKPQFAQSVLYAQAQTVAFQRATQVPGVTKPLIAAAEKEAVTIIDDNFITPTLTALHYKVSQFTIRWVAPAS